MKPLTLFAPVQKELELVEQTLRQTADVDLPWLSTMLGYMFQDGGKRIRPALTLLAARAFRDDLGPVISIAAATELLHTATLVHDDAIDESEVRRGRPTMNTRWGTRNAILVGDYLFARSAELVAITDNSRVIQIFARALMTICTGELEQDFAGDVGQREMYLRRIGNKTASLFSAATEMGAVLGGGSDHDIEALADYGYNFGVAFQIVDDILDFVGNGEEMGKPVGSDLLQGTLTLPSILLLEQRPEDNPITKVLSNQQRQRNLKLAVKEITGSSIIADCYSVARGYAARAVEGLRRLPDGESRRILQDLAEYVVERRA